MSEREKRIAETIEATLSNLPEAKKEYLLGVAEGMSVMAERQKNGVVSQSGAQTPPDSQSA